MSKFGFHTLGYQVSPKIIIYEKYYFHNYLFRLGLQELEQEVLREKKSKKERKKDTLAIFPTIKSCVIYNKKTTHG